MGVEVKGAGDGVVIAERGCNEGCGCRDHSGWGSGWGAVGGALVGGGFGRWWFWCCRSFCMGQNQ